MKTNSTTPTTLTNAMGQPTVGALKLAVEASSRTTTTSEDEINTSLITDEND